VDVTSLVRPVIEDEGLELVEVGFARESGRRVLRVTVDRPGGVDLDAVSELSLKLSRRLDEVDFGGGPYALEVSSPGIERTLSEPAHFARATGQTVKVKTAAATGRSTAVRTGALVAADDEGIVLLVDGAEQRVGYREIASATTVVDWAAELKGSHT
jgi:ribosome maturation factor RimP